MHEVIYEPFIRLTIATEDQEEVTTYEGTEEECADEFSAKICEMSAKELGIPLKEYPQVVEIKVELVVIETEFDEDGPVAYERVVDSNLFDRWVPSGKAK